MDKEILILSREYFFDSVTDLFMQLIWFLQTLVYEAIAQPDVGLSRSSRRSKFSLNYHAALKSHLGDRVPTSFTLEP